MAIITSKICFLLSAQTGGCVKYCRMRAATPLVITPCVVVVVASLASLALLIVSIAFFAVEEPRKIPEQNGRGFQRESQLLVPVESYSTPGASLPDLSAVFSYLY
jgi:hypothetical protein